MKSISDRRFLILSSGPPENLITRLLRERLDEQELVVLGRDFPLDPRPLRELAEKLAVTLPYSTDAVLRELKHLARMSQPLEHPMATYANRVPALGYHAPCTEAGAPICKGCKKREAVARGLCERCVPPNHNRRKR